MARDLSGLDVAVVMIDGIMVVGHCCVVALVITTDGTKVPVGLWLGDTENKTVVTSHLSDLVARGLLLSPPGVAPRLADPKTASSIRTIPLPEYLLSELARHMERYQPGDNGLLITTPTGQPLSRPRFYEQWRSALKGAGLPKGTVFHDLRHPYASALIEYGESVKLASATGPPPRR